MRIPAKKAILILLLVVAASSFVAVLTPQLLRVGLIQEKVSDRLESDLGSQVTIASLRWRWLPLPHLEAKGVRVTNDLLELSLPKANLYPHWRRLLFGAKIQVGTLTLLRPQLEVKKTALPSQPGSGAASLKELGALLPSLSLVIRQGTIITPALDLPDLVSIPPQTFSGVKATLDLSPSKIKLKLRAAGKAIKHLYLDGWLELPSLRYDFIGDCQGLVLRQGEGTLANGTVTPMNSEVNISAGLKGTGLKQFVGQIVGDMPCLLFEPEGRKLPISCGFGDFTLQKNDNLLALTVNKLELKNPGLTLHGEVSRTLVPNQAPDWHIALAAEALDLTSIRRSVLTLLPDDGIANEVCDIVRAGTAHSASFHFDGPLADLAHVRKMTIAADVAKAAIHVPHADLDLTDASGPILIKNGEITGSGLRAKLGNSVGSNGTLLVGLAHDHFGFKLDLDIDADLAELPAILAKEVHHHDAFQHELARFSKAKGRASGHLSLGDTLHQLSVAIQIADMEGSFRYDRLPWPVTVHGGQLTIDTDRLVRWRDVDASLGPHRINASNGSVSWHEHGKDATLAVEKLEATLDSHALLDALRDHLQLKELIAPVLDTVAGTITITPGSTLTGPFLVPEQWRYKVRLHGEDLTWHSPLLPDSMTTKSADAILSDTGLEISASRNIFSGKLLEMRGSFKHHRLHEWSGTALFSGALSNGMVAWLKSKDWLPPSLLPRTPATLDALRLTWDRQSLTINGAIVAGAGGRAQPRLQLNINSTQQNPLAMRLDFLSATEQGHLTLNLLDNIPETFSFQWQGSLTGKTTAALLADPDLLAGSLNGDFTITVPARSARTHTKGRLEAKQLRWFWGIKTEFLDLNALRLRGNGNRLDIEGLQVGFANGESLTATGSLQDAGNGLLLNAALTSPSLSLHTVNNFLDDLAVIKELLSGSPSPDHTSWPLTGTMTFDLDRFVTGATDGDGTPQTMVWNPVKGVLTLHPGGQTAIQITAAKLCCLDTSGSWYSNKALGDSHFTVATLCDPLPKFQEALPCLGFDQDLIEGEFSFNADLNGIPDNWRDGTVTILSDRGRILRMRLLAKIFSIVNLTDLFATYEATDMEKKGFPYSHLNLLADIKDNKLIIRKAVIRGEGLNLFCRGEVNLKDFEADLTVLIAPFKTLDAIISMVPWVGKAIGGENGTLISIPVGVKGPLRDPDVTLLPPSAIGTGFLNLVKDTLLLPFSILSPILPDAN